MITPVTIVTAFFDIDRASRGDGRTIEEYLQWIQHTLQLNAHLFVVTEPKYAPYFQSNRPSQYPIFLHVMDFKESYYYRYYDRMKEIVRTQEYRNKIAHPNRVECILPEYNIIQYSKFHYLQIAIKKNPYHSTHFLWMDAGASRFFDHLKPSLSYPTSRGCERLVQIGDKFLAQRRHDLFHYPINEYFVWKSDNLIYGGTFGGSIEAIQRIAQELEKTFQTEMLDKNNVNNEQLCLALVWKKHPEWFHLISGPNCLETFHYLA
jgi:hypothetical protein